jgi:hypothetical protein
VKRPAWPLSKQTLRRGKIVVEERLEARGVFARMKKTRFRPVGALDAGFWGPSSMHATRTITAIWVNSEPAEAAKLSEEAKAASRRLVC